jgi:hypothetical protein
MRNFLLFGMYYLLISSRLSRLRIILVGEKTKFWGCNGIRLTCPTVWLQSGHFRKN